MRRAVLVSPVFAIKDAGMAELATNLVYSEIGGLALPLAAEDYYLAGGYCNDCLNLTAVSLVNQALRADAEVARLHVIVPLTYEFRVGALSRLTPSELAAAEAVFKQKLIDGLDLEKRGLHFAWHGDRVLEVARAGGRPPLRINIQFEGVP